MPVADKAAAACGRSWGGALTSAVPAGLWFEKGTPEELSILVPGSVPVCSPILLPEDTASKSRCAWSQAGMAY